jgi:hypothetical protein
MKVAQIKDLQNLADGTVIGQMTVNVKAVFPPKTGEGKYGPWRVQSCVLQDGTGEVRASFWIQDEMKSLQGQTITIKSQAGKKGLDGLSVQFSKHSSSNELKVTEKAAILDQADEFVVKEKFPNGNTAPAAITTVSSVDDAKKVIFANAKLYVECCKAAGWVSGQVEQMSEAHMQACVASLFISAERAGLAKVFNEPKKPAEPKPESKPLDLDLDGDDIGF